MAKTSVDSGFDAANQGHDTLTFHASGTDKIELPSSEFIADAKMTRDGDDLVLVTPGGETAVVEGYFSADPAPLLQSPDGSVLTPNLVDSFSRSPSEFAANGTTNDESPIGAVEEVQGNATVTRADGTIETVTIGTPIYQGDIVETDAKGAVNITFIDETSMAVSENARLAIDQYTFDPATESGTTNFSVLRGLFVFTSGLIGRDDPDDVKIDTPVGSIGIRGTIIAGEINPAGESKITVLEGAIVVTNGNMETTLSQQYETVRLGDYDKPMEPMGVVPGNDISSRFSSVSAVSPTLFSTIEGSSATERPASDPAQSQPANTSPEPQSMQQAPQDTAPVQSAPASLDSGIANLNGSTSGLPTSEIVAGGTSSSPVANEFSGSTVTSPSSATSAGTTHPAASGGSTPASTDSIASPVVTTQPPPSVINGTTGTTAPSLIYTNTGVTDIANAGAVIGHITMGVSGFSYALNNSTPYYTLVTNGNGVDVVLTTAGKQYLDGNFETRQFSNIDVTATSTNTGTVMSSVFTPVVTDANGPTTIRLETGPANIPAIGDNIDNHIGYTVTALGDINNDGFDDFAFSNNTGNAGQNHSYIMYGFNGFLPNDAGTLPTTHMDVRVNPSILSVGDFSQSVIAGIGDFNGDGIEDYIVGQGNNSISGVAGGNSAIVSGNNSSSSRSFGTSLYGAGSQAGSSADGIGDFNNDGYADVIIGAPGSDMALLVRGNDASWGTTLNSATTQISGTTGSNFGAKVLGIGDFDGDGYSDFAVSAPGANSNDGRVTIYRGSDAGGITSTMVLNGTGGNGLGEDFVGVGDINGDGKSDLWASDSNNISYLYLGSDTTADATVNLSGMAGTSIAGAGGIGDFNGDGYDDFVLATQNGTESNTFVVFGKNSFSGTIDADYLKDPSNALEISFNQTLGSGVEINSVGDVNGDGYDDFAMSMDDINGGDAGSGGFYLFYGRGTGTAGANVHVGTSGDNTLSDGGANNAVLRGGAGNDMLHLSNTNFLQIDGGSNTTPGFDAIISDQSLDFRNVDFEKMSGIEAIIYGGSNQTITLTVENLFNMLKTSDNGILKISANGNTGLSLVLDDGDGTDDYASATTADTVNFLNDGTGGGTAASHNTATSGYDTFVIGGYKLLIDTAIAVDAQ